MTCLSFIVTKGKKICIPVTLTQLIKILVFEPCADARVNIDLHKTCQRNKHLTLNAQQCMYQQMTMENEYS